MLARTGSTLIEMQTMVDATNVAKAFAIDLNEVIEIVPYCGRCEIPIHIDNTLRLCADCRLNLFKRA